jgi:hypothetical protein
MVSEITQEPNTPRCRNCGATIEPIETVSTTYRHTNKAFHCDLDDDASLTAEPMIR